MVNSIGGLYPHGYRIKSISTSEYELFDIVIFLSSLLRSVWGSRAREHACAGCLSFSFFFSPRARRHVRICRKARSVLRARSKSPSPAGKKKMALAARTWAPPRRRGQEGPRGGKASSFQWRWDVRVRPLKGERKERRGEGRAQQWQLARTWRCWLGPVGFSCVLCALNTVRKRRLVLCVRA